MAKQTSDTEGQDPSVALNDVITEIHGKETEHGRVSRLLGDAYARRQTGKGRDTTAEIGKLTFQRTTIENDLRDLRLTEASLKAEIAQRQADAEARKGGQAVAEFEQVTNEARELERHFASLMREALSVGKQLQEKQRIWGRARAAVSPHADVKGIIAPRLPAALVRPDGLEDPDRTVDRWLIEPVKRGPEQPPRLLTERDVLQVGNADAESLTIVERIHDKLSQKIGA